MPIATSKNHAPLDHDTCPPMHKRNHPDRPNNTFGLRIGVDDMCCSTLGARSHKSTVPVFVSSTTLNAASSVVQIASCGFTISKDGLISGLILTSLATSAAVVVTTTTTVTTTGC